MNVGRTLIKPNPIRRMGLRMSGLEHALEDLIKQHAPRLPLDQIYNLLEIGSAGCVTLRAFSDILREVRPENKWRAIGIHLTPDKAWSLDMAQVATSFAGMPYQVQNGGESFATGMSLALFDDPRVFLSSTPFIFDFVFIDGCHGKCVGLDFLAIENKVNVGGLVVFHDYGQAEQGEDWQPHCREFINVRTYVHRLGLAEPCVVARKGWRWVGEIPGSRLWGGDGNSAAVVQRTEEPLEKQDQLSLD